VGRRIQVKNILCWGGGCLLWRWCRGWWRLSKKSQQSSLDRISVPVTSAMQPFNRLQRGNRLLLRGILIAFWSCESKLHKIKSCGHVILDVGGHQKLGRTSASDDVSCGSFIKFVCRPYKRNAQHPWWQQRGTQNSIHYEMEGKPFFQARFICGRAAGTAFSVNGLLSFNPLRFFWILGTWMRRICCSLNISGALQNGARCLAEVRFPRFALLEAMLRAHPNEARQGWQSR